MNKQDILNRYSTTSIVKTKVVEQVVVEKKVDVNETLKSPICSFMGHVDAGKTSLMDIIRNTSIQKKEAGGITQSIGSSFVSIEDIVDTTNMIKGKFEVKPEIPGLLIIDTPGHEAFNILRERGSGLCDVAVLVVDILDGIKPQTVESIKLLRERKIPFVIAATKLDRINNYIKTEELSLRKAFNKQRRETITLIETAMYDIQYELEKEKIKSEFYFKNKDPKKVYSIIPISCVTKEGLADLLSLLVFISQNWMNKKIVYKDQVDATIMECYQDKKHGWVLDIILKNGTIKIGDEFAVSARGGEKIVKIRKLLTSDNNEVEFIKASSGVKIIGSNCDGCLSGTKLYPNNKDALELANKEMKNIWDKMPIIKQGVCIQAPVISNLDALHQLLSKDKIPIMNINLKILNEKDILKIITKFIDTNDKELKCLLYFGKVNINEELTFEKLCVDNDIKFLHSEVVYKLIEDYLEYKKQCLEERQKNQISKSEAVFPCKLKILKQHIYIKGGSENLMFGVKVKAGTLNIGTPIKVVSNRFRNKGKIINIKTEKELILGKVISIQNNNKEVNIGELHDEICIRLDNPNELSYDRQFNSNDELVSNLSRESIDILKKDYREEMSKSDWLLIIELKNLLCI